MKITRRQLLVSTALVPVAACAQLTNAITAVPAVASDVNRIAGALQKIEPTIEALTGLAGGAKATIEATISQVSALAGQIAAASPTDVTGLVSQFAGGVAAIAGPLLGMPFLPAAVNIAINAALALVPTIEQVVGIVSAPQAARVAMTPDQARAALDHIIQS